MPTLTMIDHHNHPVGKYICKSWSATVEAQFKTPCEEKHCHWSVAYAGCEIFDMGTQGVQWPGCPNPIHEWYIYLHWANGGFQGSKCLGSPHAPGTPSLCSWRPPWARLVLPEVGPASPTSVCAEGRGGHPRPLHRNQMSHQDPCCHLRNQELLLPLRFWWLEPYKWPFGKIEGSIWCHILVVHLGVSSE